jgi:iron(II)-dependent oxidoreductase
MTCWRVFARPRAETDRLFDHVKPEYLYERPIPERHRIVFYVGHLEAFDWNLLRERVLGRTSFHSEFDHLFAFGIDPVDGGLPKDQPSDWPSLSQVREYVSQVRRALDEGLSGVDLSEQAGQGKIPGRTNCS